MAFKANYRDYAITKDADAMKRLSKFCSSFKQNNPNFKQKANLAANQDASPRIKETKFQ